jgi:hypothetical protein
MSDNYVSGFQTSTDGGVFINNRVWDGDTMSWVAQTIASIGAVPASVEVTNWPGTQTVDGAVDIGNLPEVQTVDGSVSVSNFPATQPVSGTVAVSNFPATQPVSGSITVSSLPAIPAGANTIGAVNINGTIPVSGTFWQGTQPVSIATLPSLAAGSNAIGSITNTTFAATQSGTWNVGITKSALTPASPATASVGITSAQAVASNGSRKGLLITNLSNNFVSLGLGATAVLNSGITLTPYGSWQMDSFSFCTSAVNAIASAASSTISVQEFS